MSEPDPAEQVLPVTDGQGRMPPFVDSLNTDEVYAVVAEARDTF